MNSKLIGHLKSDDFFAAAKFPVSKLELTGAKKLAGNDVEFSGNLTIKGITNPVTFKATTVIEGKNLTAEGNLVINRAKFDVRYGSGSFFGGLGDKVIYDDFTLVFTLVATEK
jgi:polyisoprenoid-binding protein YceI